MARLVHFLVESTTRLLRITTLVALAGATTFLVLANLDALKPWLPRTGAETAALRKASVRVRHLSLSGQLSEALALCERALEAHGENPDVLEQRGWLQDQLDRDAEALAAYDRVLKLDPRRARVHASCGHVLTELFEIEDAERAFARALALDETCADAYLGRAHLLHITGEVERALETIEGAMRFFAEDERFLAQRGYLLLAVGRAQDAREAYERLPADYPHRAALLAPVLEELGQYGEAVEQYEVAMHEGARGAEIALLRCALALDPPPDGVFALEMARATEPALLATSFEDAHGVRALGLVEPFETGTEVRAEPAGLAEVFYLWGGVRAALERYRGLLATLGLEAVVATSRLELREPAGWREVGGCYTRDEQRIYILLDEHARGSLRRSVHHEVYHLLDATGLARWPDYEWMELNERGVAAYDARATELAAHQHGASDLRGFVSVYARSDVGEDRAELFAEWMTDRDALRARAAADPILAAKLELLCSRLAASDTAGVRALAARGASVPEN